MEEHIKKLSKKKIIYIEIDDEITTIFDKLKSVPHKEIYLMAPKRAALFHSIVNLKILKSKLADLGKELAIITHDPVGLKLITQAGIRAFDQLEADVLATTPRPKVALDEPVAARGNEQPDENPKRMKNKKMAIIDIVKRTRDIAQYKFGLMMPFNRIKAKIQQPRETKLVLITPSKRAFSTLLVASIGLFILIAYFALPGATIELTTSPNVLQRSVNITLADAVRNSSEFKNPGGKLIATYPVSASIEKTLPYNSTGEYFEGSNATGKITIINKGPNNWPLVANTRFQTPDGLVFRVKQFVTIPGTKQVEKTREDGSTYTDTIPGEIEVYVVADTEDAFGKIIGDRGNIQPTTFFVPGLSKTSQNILYATSKEPFTGGQTVSKPRVVQEDIDAAKQKLLETLKGEGVERLREEVERQNRLKNTSLRLMEDSFVLEFSEPAFTVPDGLISQELEEFTISGTITVTGIAYNFNEVMNMLKQDLKLHKSPEKYLVYIYDKSFTYDIVDIDAKNKKIKITASIKGIEEFDIDPESENGQRLSKKIKEHVLGKSKKEASAYIQNLPEVNKVNIKTWPGWAPNLPSVPENIKIKVIQGEPVEEAAKELENSP